jgi:hypothetical protein
LRKPRLLKLKDLKMLNLQLIKKIDKLAYSGLSYKRKLQLLFWRKKRLEKVIKIIEDKQKINVI